MHANDESNTNKQDTKVCEYTLFWKKAPTRITRPPNTQAVNANKQANEVCEDSSF